MCRCRYRYRYRSQGEARETEEAEEGATETGKGDPSSEAMAAPRVARWCNTDTDVSVVILTLQIIDYRL